MNALKRFVLALCCMLLAQDALAHGSVTAEGDLCLIRIGYFTAHFKIFQPQLSREKEFCEDLPRAGESVFVMDYVHQGLAAVPIEFRIIRNTTGLGRFARVADVQALGDLDPLTVFHQEPVIERGVFTVLHEFPDTGEFLGIVSVRNPENGALYEAVFPFSVGYNDWGLWPLIVVLAALAQLGFWVSTGGWTRWRANRERRKGQSQIAMLLPLLLLFGAAAPEERVFVSDGGTLRASYTSDVLPLPLNAIHAWTLHLERRDGISLENATVTVDGGMPAHNHGLPTVPAVTADLGNGDYRVEGLRFHMQGDWVLRVVVDYDGMRDTIRIPLTL
jgi:hypothetical protein